MSVIDITKYIKGDLVLEAYLTDVQKIITQLDEENIKMRAEIVQCDQLKDNYLDLLAEHLELIVENEWLKKG